MGDHEHVRSYPVEEAVRAQKALRDLAGLDAEMFPVQAFVGMISDEVELLRNQELSDEQIAETIRTHSRIEISAEEIATHYAGPQERHGDHAPNARQGSKR